MTRVPAAAASRLAEVDPGSWDDVLAELGCGDVYLQREYLASACVLDRGRPTLLHLGDSGGDVVFACIVRDVEGSPSADVTTPYGYGGPVALGDDPPTQRFYELYERWCAERGVVATFLRFHPLFANHRYAGPSFHLEELPGTVGWRLEGDLFASMHAHHRRVVRKARSAGVTVSAHPAPADVADFVALYEETMRRHGARSFYLFPPAYWEALTRLGERLVRFDARLDGELVASALCLAGHPWLHYHLGGTAADALATGASHALMLEAALWAQERGFDEFHLGGGVLGRDDSLFTYKLRFFPDGRRAAWLGKAVHDVETYLELARADSVTFDGFFPAYRPPVD